MHPLASFYCNRRWMFPKKIAEVCEFKAERLQHKMLVPTVTIYLNALDY